MTIKYSLVVPLVLALVGVGCTASRQAARLEGRYVLGDPGAGWSRVSSGGADQAFYNEELSASIYADSNCGVRYEDAPLETLASHLTHGLSDRSEGSANQEELDGRASVTVKVEGEIDGVRVALATTVLKKDFCVYDLVLVSPPAQFDRAWPGFLDVRAGFDTRSGE